MRLPRILPMTNRTPLWSLEPGLVPHGVNLFEHRLENHLLARTRWEKTIEAVNELPIPDNVGRKATATEKEAKQLHHALKTNEVFSKMDQLIPEGGCFGIAMLGHLMALHAGFDKQSLSKVLKIWEDGGMEKHISHHFAFAVRADDGGWWVIDYLDPGPKKFERWGSPGTFMAEANRWGIEGQHAEGYNPLQLFKWVEQYTPIADRNAPLYNGFINEVKSHFKSNPTSALDIPLPKRVRKPKVLGDADAQTLEMLNRDRNRSSFEPAAGT